MLTGLGLWVWYWDDRFIEMAQRIGATYLLIKAADGLTPWAQWSQAAPVCRSAGILPIPWSYNYGDAREPDVLRNAAPDSNILVVDPEVEYEGLPLAQQLQFAQGLQALRVQGLTIGAACFARPEGHQGYHYPELGASIDFWLPMVAWPYWNPPDVTYWLDFWDSFHLGKTIPWLPTYSDDAGTLIDPNTFLQSIRIAFGRYGAVTIWAAHTIHDEQVAILETAKQDWLGLPPLMAQSSSAPLILEGLMLVTSGLIIYRLSKGGAL